MSNHGRHRGDAQMMDLFATVLIVGTDILGINTHDLSSSSGVTMVLISSSGFHPFVQLGIVHGAS